MQELQREATASIAAGKPFSVDAAVAYVEGLDAYGATVARQYVKQAPDFVQTPVRRALQRFVEAGG